MQHKIRTQKRIQGSHRKPVGTAVDKLIESWLREQMRLFRVSRSFVIATAIADVANIKLRDDYRKPLLLKKRA